MLVPLPRPSRAVIAFSLVEVVLALAVVSFALIAILSLLSVALQQTQASQAQTIASLIAQDANARARLCWTNIETTPLPVGSPSVIMASNNFYYTDAGIYTNAPGATTVYEASVVVCGLNKANYSSGNYTNFPDSTLNWDGQLAGLTITVRWPLSATGTPLSANNKITFATEIAKQTDPRWPTATSYTTQAKP